MRPAAPVRTTSGIRTLSAQMALSGHLEYLTTALGLPKSQPPAGPVPRKAAANNIGPLRNARKLHWTASHASLHQRQIRRHGDDRPGATAGRALPRRSSRGDRDASGGLALL